MISISELAEYLNFQAELREDLDENNLDMLQFEYEKMFKNMCGQVPIFKIIDKKGRIHIYGYLEHVPKR